MVPENSEIETHFIVCMQDSWSQFGRTESPAMDLSLIVATNCIHMVYVLVVV
jgi:hypothetical protein